MSQHELHGNQIDFFPFPGFIVNNKNDVEDHTPISKIPCGSVLNCVNSSKSTDQTSTTTTTTTTTTKTPPAEPSVSPEIQSTLRRSVLVSGAAPSTCYGAGHIISGVNDRRKCKARGILSVGHKKPLEQEFFTKSRPSLVPFPVEASISWNLSPSYNNDEDDHVVGKHDSPKGLHQSWKIVESFDFNGECSPFSVDSLGSANVMQTPNTDSSLERRANLSPNDRSSPWDPPRLSAELADLSSPPENLDIHESWISNATSENVSESQIWVSWRDGLVSGSFDKEDLDCCRLLSDEEIDDDKHKACAESICNDDSGLIASDDSDWNLCYKDQSFEI